MSQQQSFAVWTLLKDIRDEPNWLDTLRFLEWAPLPISSLAEYLGLPDHSVREIVSDLAWDDLVDPSDDGLSCRISEKGLGCIERINWEEA